MLTLKIIKNTFAKQSSKPSETLSDNQKHFIRAGQELKIKFYIKQGKHYFVKLKEELENLGKSAFFFGEHIEIEEIRAVWITNIDSDLLLSKDNIKQGLQKLKNSGFNTIYPVVWNKGFAFFQSSLVDNTVNSDPTKLTSVGLEIGLARRDILAEMIEINQQEGHDFRIIPWFEYGLMLNRNCPLVSTKPEWLMLANTGDDKRIVNDKCWLNPIHPEVKEFLTSLIREVVKNYDIDGIQLDDHFGIPHIKKINNGIQSRISMGFDTFTINLFKQETGAANPVNNPNSEKFKAWRKNKLTELLKLIFQTVKAEKDDCIISISPNPLSFSLDNYLADWQIWEKEGIIEELALQVYRYQDTFDKNMAAFEREIDKLEVKNARNHIPTVIGIIAGLKPNNKRVPLNLIQSQTEATRDRDFAGFSYFFYGSLFDLGFDNETPESRFDTFAEILSTDQFV